MELKRAQYFYVFFSALLFGTGLAVSGFLSPNKVLQFLAIGDFNWNPSLLIVFFVAISVYAVGFALMTKRRLTFFGNHFSPPAHHTITPRLLLGAVIFGLGWGITGLCPSTGIMRLVTLQIESLMFVVGLLAGLYFARSE